MAQIISEFTEFTVQDNPRLAIAPFSQSGADCEWPIAADLTDRTLQLRSYISGVILIVLDLVRVGRSQG